MSRKAAKGEGSGASADGGKKRKKSKGDAEPGAEMAIRVGAHPRACQSIRRARAYAGMIGFAAVLLLALRAGVPPFESMLRALGGGLVLHFATWALAIALWRRLIVAELESARARLMERSSSARVPAAGSGVS